MTRNNDSNFIETDDNIEDAENNFLNYTYVPKFVEDESQTDINDINNEDLPYITIENKEILKETDDNIEKITEEIGSRGDNSDTLSVIENEVDVDNTEDLEEIDTGINGDEINENKDDIDIRKYNTQGKRINGFDEELSSWIMGKTYEDELRNYNEDENKVNIQLPHFIDVMNVNGQNGKRIYFEDINQHNMGIEYKNNKTYSHYNILEESDCVEWLNDDIFAISTDQEEISENIEELEAVNEEIDTIEETTFEDEVAEEELAEVLLEDEAEIEEPISEEPEEITENERTFEDEVEEEYSETQSFEDEINEEEITEESTIEDKVEEQPIVEEELSNEIEETHTFVSQSEIQETDNIIDSSNIVVDSIEDNNEVGVDLDILKARYKTVDLDKRLCRADESVKEYYSEIKNFIMSYNGVKSRISKKFDTFSIGRFVVAKVTVRGNVLKLYLALLSDSLEEKYHTADVSKSETYGKTPTLHNVKSKRGCKYGIELIREIMEGLGLVQNDEYIPVDYVAMYPPENIEEKKNAIRHMFTESISIEDCEKLSDDDALEYLEIIKDKAHTINKFKPINKYVVYLDDIDNLYNNGDNVNIEDLIQKEILPAEENIFLEIRGKGSLTHKLNIEAHSFDLASIKMIILTDGTVKQYK